MTDLTNFVRIDENKLTGNVATLTFHIDFTGEPVESDNPDAPKYRIFAKSPRGRKIEVGAIWQNTNREDKPYYALSMNTGHSRFYANLGRYPGQEEDNVLAVIEQQRRGQGAWAPFSCFALAVQTRRCPGSVVQILVTAQYRA